MTLNNLSHKAAHALSHFWGVLVLILWGGALLGFGLLRFDSYGLDESAARGLLLIWSIFDKIINPIFTLGIPDFRALLFIPLGLYWPGSIVAAKVFTLILSFSAIALLYVWSKRSSDGESALLASALLLVSPHLINGMDSLATGPFLLLAFGLGAWLDKAYRRVNRPLGGWFFAQLLWASVTLTLHPIGLAYVLMLAWTWYKNPIDAHQRRHVLIGLALVTILLLVLRQGWETIPWLSNPLLSLAQAHQIVPELTQPNWFVGGLLAALLAITAWVDRRFLSTDPVGLMFLLALGIGLLAADQNWALLAVALLLYRGIPHLIALNQHSEGTGLIRQRGIVIIVLFIATTTFMLTDKTRALALKQEIFSPQDQLIRQLALEAADPEQEFRAASQWPGRTMLAVRRDVFPLPAAQADGESFLKSITGITHMIFDHKAPENLALGKNIAELSGIAETLALEESGVIIHIRDMGDNANSADEAGAPHAAPAPDGASTPSQ